MILNTQWIADELSDDEFLMLYTILTKDTSYQFHTINSICSILPYKLVEKVAAFEAQIESLTDEGAATFNLLKAKLVDFGILSL